MSVELFVGVIYLIGIISFVSVIYDTIVKIYEKIKNRKGKRKMENYIILNGKRIDLTEDQIKVLTEEEKREDVIHRVQNGEKYIFLDEVYDIADSIECSCIGVDEVRFEAGNYYPPECERLAIQDALHDELRRRLRKFSRNNGWNDDVWEDDAPKYYIYMENGRLTVHFDNCWCRNDIYFVSEEIARRAIKEVVEPFAFYNPKFLW